MDIVILCGGIGTRMGEETVLNPKPMIEIGGKPILWHIMKIYSQYRANRFILCLGYKGEVVKSFFLNYPYISSDFTIKLGNKANAKIHNYSEENEWEITLADTGKDTLKGGRIKRVEKYIKSDPFMLTYGDGLANIDLEKLLQFHLAHGKIATLTGVYPPSRFGELLTKGESVIKFREKPQTTEGLINGGFFVFSKKFLEFLKPNIDCDLERGALEELARQNELKVYRHHGAWACMDTVRDLEYLNRLWDSGKSFWNTPIS